MLTNYRNSRNNKPRYDTDNGTVTCSHNRSIGEFQTTYSVRCLCDPYQSEATHSNHLDRFFFVCSLPLSVTLSSIIYTCVNVNWTQHTATHSLLIFIIYTIAAKPILKYTNKLTKYFGMICMIETLVTYILHERRKRRLPFGYDDRQ